MRRALRTTVAAAFVAVALAGCGGPDADGHGGGDGSPGDAEETVETPPGATEESDVSSVDCSPTEGALHPDVVAATVEATGDGSWTVSATLCSAYDSASRYADAFRVLTPDGTELGVRELTHPHADEQPFTRTLPGVSIPEDVAAVTVEGRDLENGWGGATVTVPVEHGA